MLEARCLARRGLALLRDSPWLSAVASAEGVLSLWHGFLPYYGRCGGHTVTMFVAVDQIRTMYKRYTNPTEPPKAAPARGVSLIHPR